MSSAQPIAIQGRPRDSLGDRILAAASQILSEQGAQGLSVRRIAEQAGTSTMGVYSRFGSKLGVIDALYREGFERLRQATESVMDQGEPLAVIEELCVVYRNTALANATHYDIMFGHAFPGFEPSPEARATAFEGFEQVVVATVRAAVDAGTLRGDPLELAYRLWSLIHGMVSLELSGVLPPPTAAVSERLMRRAVRSYLRGLRATVEESEGNGA